MLTNQMLSRAAKNPLVARAQFLCDSGGLESAELRISPVAKKPGEEPFEGLGAAVEAMKNVSWTKLEELKGDEGVLKRLDEAENLLRSLRRALTSD